MCVWGGGFRVCNIFDNLACARDNGKGWAHMHTPLLNFKEIFNISSRVKFFNLEYFVEVHSLYSKKNLIKYQVVRQPNRKIPKEENTLAT